ncbi:MAG TPA: HAMP domain-containing sensor histidine kinase [Actinoplanes sp.]|nr:HAMP domain-containing sensor histidine kinase [Actinoplanes sp.]
MNDVVATVSHEIRTPLTAIRGYAEMLADTSLASAYVSQLAAIDRNSLRLCRTVDTLLRALNQQRNKPAGNRQVVDLATLAKAAAAEVGPSNSRIRYEMPARPIEVYADRRLLEVAVGHLLSNALNFSDVDQPVTVTIGDRHGPAIQVHDNGPGLDESELSRLGAPFFRGTYAHRHELPGVGLGLAVTEHIVRAQGASLHFSSPPGGGLTAQILFS